MDRKRSHELLCRYYFFQNGVIDFDCGCKGVAFLGQILALNRVLAVILLQWATK
jgi:hypothetical protein